MGLIEAVGKNGEDGGGAVAVDEVDEVRGRKHVGARNGPTEGCAQCCMRDRENIRLSLTCFTTTPNHASHVVLRRRHKGWIHEQDRNRYCIALGYRRKDRQGSS